MKARERERERGREKEIYIEINRDCKRQVLRERENEIKWESDSEREREREIEYSSAESQKVLTSIIVRKLNYWIAFNKQVKRWTRCCFVDDAYSMETKTKSLSLIDNY